MIKAGWTTWEADEGNLFFDKTTGEECRNVFYRPGVEAMDESKLVENKHYFYGQKATFEFVRLNEIDGVKRTGKITEQCEYPYSEKVCDLGLRLGFRVR